MREELAEEKTVWVVPEAYAGVRIDKALSAYQPEISRSFWQKLLAEKRITVDGQTAKSSQKLTAGACIVWSLPEPEPLEVVPEDIPLDILYEDKDVILINKGKNMVVHPAAGHMTGTIVNALLYHCPEELSGIGGVARPGIVHRIDRDTTGVIIVCKNDYAHQHIAAQLKSHSIIRRYHALTWQPFSEEEGSVNAPIGRHLSDRKKMAVNYKNGKEAVTHYRLVENLQGKYAHIICSLETGRTHQIRVHMASIHHPLLGDPVYGSAKNPFHLEGQALHAEVLGFIHPSTGRYMEFHAPFPEYFTALLKKLGAATIPG
ncbi:MAG: RluA family pseudouridine synthase [Lachnospiraceae bacterium]|nr:RluA family pseudouridine synthase [Lachnospiraceae bacterium]